MPAFERALKINPNLNEPLRHSSELRRRRLAAAAPRRSAVAGASDVDGQTAIEGHNSAGALRVTWSVLTPGLDIYWQADAGVGLARGELQFEVMAAGRSSCGEIGVRTIGWEKRKTSTPLGRCCPSQKAAERRSVAPFFALL